MGWTSPVKSTSGHPWPAPAPSFSCHWSSPSSATTVSSRGAWSGAKRFAPLPPCALLAPGSPCQEIGWKFLGPELHCGVRHSPFLSWRQNSRNRFPLLFPLSGTFFRKIEPLSQERQQNCVPLAKAKATGSAVSGLLQTPAGEGVPLWPWD